MDTCWGIIHLSLAFLEVKPPDSPEDLLTGSKAEDRIASFTIRQDKFIIPFRTLLLRDCRQLQTFFFLVLRSKPCTTAWRRKKHATNTEDLQQCPYHTEQFSEWFSACSQGFPRLSDDGIWRQLINYQDGVCPKIVTVQETWLFNILLWSEDHQWQKNRHQLAEVNEMGVAYVSHWVQVLHQQNITDIFAAILYNC